MRKVVAVMLALTLLLIAGATLAQSNGSIRGLVYQDVNGDGKCVNTGVAGEVAVPNINVEFVSSDAKTILTLHTGPEGSYGLVAAGYSYWGVTAKPGAEWVVTSQKTIYVPIDGEHLLQTGVNFCVQKASLARVVLPVSGAAANWGSLLAGLVGLGMVGAGVSLEWRRRRAL